MRKISFLLVLMMALSFSAIASGDYKPSEGYSTPAKAVEAFFNKGVTLGSFENACMATYDFKVVYTMVEVGVKDKAEADKARKEQAAKFKEQFGTVKSYEILYDETVTNGKDATVKVKLIRPDGDEVQEFAVTNANGKWFIYFNLYK